MVNGHWQYHKKEQEVSLPQIKNKKKKGPSCSPNLKLDNFSFNMIDQLRCNEVQCLIIYIRYLRGFNSIIKKMPIWFYLEIYMDLLICKTNYHSLYCSVVQSLPNRNLEENLYDQSCTLLSKYAKVSYLSNHIC